jgi:hypothetical protein
MMHESMIQRQNDEIYAREFAALLVARERAKRAIVFEPSPSETGDSDFCSEGSMDEDEEAERQAFIREDTEPAEERDVGPSQTSRSLGRQDTEIIDHDTFGVPVSVYPQAWVAGRKMVRWQPTENYLE